MEPWLHYSHLRAQPSLAGRGRRAKSGRPSGQPTWLRQGSTRGRFPSRERRGHPYWRSRAVFRVTLKQIRDVLCALRPLAFLLARGSPIGDPVLPRVVRDHVETYRSASRAVPALQKDGIRQRSCFQPFAGIPNSSGKPRVMRITTEEVEMRRIRHQLGSRRHTRASGVTCGYG